MRFENTYPVGVLSLHMTEPASVAFERLATRNDLPGTLSTRHQ